MDSNDTTRADASGSASDDHRPQQPFGSRPVPVQTDAAIKRWMLGCLGTGLLLLLVGLGGCPAYRYWYDRNGDADVVVDAAFADSMMIGVESIHHRTSSSRRGGVTTSSGYETFRLSAIDLADGRLRAREVLGDREERADYIGRAGDAFWFYGHDPDVGLHARNPVTLGIVHGREELIATSPLFAGLLAVSPALAGYYCVDTASGHLFVTMADGKGYLIDPATLAPGPVRDHPVCADRDRDAFERRVLLRDGRDLSLRGDPRQELVIGTKGVPDASIPPATFLNARFICSTEDGTAGRSPRPPLDAGDPASVLVMHDSRIGQGNVPILSRVALGSGSRIEWSIELKEVAADVHLGPLVVERAHRVGESVVMVIGERAYRIDLKSGSVLWTRHF